MGPRDTGGRSHARERERSRRRDSSLAAVVFVAPVAVGASAIALSQRERSYTATAKLLSTPVAQYDETFLGTSLVRDPGDANRTAPTAVELLDSDEVAVASARRLGGVP